MIPLPAGLPRRFAAVAARCGTGKSAPPVVVCRTTAGVLTVCTTSPNGVRLMYTAPTDAADAVLVLPSDVLPALAAARGPVELRSTGGLRAEARWADDSGPKSHPFPAVKPGRQHAPPPAVTARVPCPPTLLAALHACGKATARRDPTPRFALDRVCLSGSAGRVIGSDGKTAVLAGPVPLPFADDRLVPAVPVFGSAELTSQPDVAVGVGDGVVAVKAGPWCVRLSVVPGRYPDVPAVLPKHRPTVGEIDESDARQLLSRLPELPGQDDPDAPVTIALMNGGVAVLAADGSRTERVPLPRSPAAGPKVRVAVPRAVLARAVKLGCRTVKVWAADRPVAFAGGLYTVLAAPLGPDAVVPDDSVSGAGSTATPDVLNPNPQTRRRVMRPTEPTRPADDGLPSDPLAEAEELRAALADALGRATKLVSRLRGRKKEQKALTSVWTSLKSLGLDREGRP